ncbi:MAG: stage III sporulation protein AF, partial [Deltaproteobacteria bacterium]
MMFEALKGWVASIIAVILFVSLVEIILPEGKMRKYVNLTAGVLVVLIIISPLFKVFNKSIEIDIPEMSLKESVPLEELKIQGEKIGNMRSKQIIYAYREKMAKNIREQVNEIEGISCEKVVCKIIEDAGKESFGDIQDVTLYINKKQHQGTKSNIQP